MIQQIKARLLQLSLLLFLAPAAPLVKGAPEAPIVLWPGGAPGAVGNEPGDIPTLTPYLPSKEKATGAAIIVCPGGGYRHLADHESRPVAEWLNSIGITAFVLRYRLGPYWLCEKSEMPRACPVEFHVRCYKTAANGSRMPRACPVEPHACGYKNLTYQC